MRARRLAAALAALAAAVTLAPRADAGHKRKHRAATHHRDGGGDDRARTTSDGDRAAGADDDRARADVDRRNERRDPFDISPPATDHPAAARDDRDDHARDDGDRDDHARDDADRADHARAAPTPAPADPADPTRGYLRTQLDAQWDVAVRTRDTVVGKLDARAAERAHRARAAYQLLASDAARPWTDAGDRMAAARRAAAARHLLAVDRGEVALLADEVVRLHAGLARLTADRAAVETLALPAPGLAWPARGDVARRFGTFVHDDSRATLSRHGVDLDVDAHAEARAVADGVVRYAGPIRGLDAGVVVDHGGYWSIVGKLGELAVAAGDRVARGQRLGDAARHRVYLELRVPLGVGGTPVDPEPLLAPKP